MQLVLLIRDNESARAYKQIATGFSRSPRSVSTSSKRGAQMPHKKVVRSLSTVFFLGVCTFGSWAQSPPPGMSYEETVVRTTYAKLAYAAKIGAIHNALAD